MKTMQGAESMASWNSCRTFASDSPARSRNHKSSFSTPTVCHYCRRTRCSSRPCCRTIMACKALSHHVGMLQRHSRSM